MALIYIRLLLPRSSKSEELIHLTQNYTFEPKCTTMFPCDTRDAQEAITAYLQRNRFPWSQNFRIVEPRTQDGSHRPNQPESTEVGDNISPLSAQHDNSSVNELPEESALRKENGCLLQ